MGAVTALPWGRELTQRDLESLPDDGHRYELLDGVLLVSPSPTPLHQIAVANVLHALERDRPSDLRVLIAPLDVVLADNTVLQPDVLVARRQDLTDSNLPAHRSSPSRCCHQARNASTASPSTTGTRRRASRTTGSSTLSCPA